MINEEQKARGQEDKLVNPSPQPSPTRGEGVNSRVDFSLPLITGLPSSLRSLAMTKPAFTLAEVLITLGIIGIVAAMTMPALIENHRRHVIESRLKQFYSIINQAVKMSVIENGDVENWDIIPSPDQDGTIEWINKYLSKYLTILKIDKCTSGTKDKLYYPSGCIFFNNGSGVAIHAHVWFFYPDAKKIGKSGMVCGKDFFAFFMSNNSIKTILSSWADYEDWQLGGYAGAYGCSSTNTHHCSGWMCTRIIERNGWTIPKSYPYKF